MAFGDGDFPVFFADFGEVAVINGVTVTVIPESPLSMFEHGGVGSIEQAAMKISAPITAFNTLPVPGNPVVFRGANWIVKSRLAPGDGRVLELELKATS